MVTCMLLCPALSCRIPYENLLGLTGLLLTCDYNGKEFVRVGYYVNIEYTDPELCDLVAANTPPNPHRIDKLQRNIASGERRASTACSHMAITSCCDCALGSVGGYRRQHSCQQGCAATADKWDSYLACTSK